MDSDDQVDDESDALRAALDFPEVDPERRVPPVGASWSRANPTPSPPMAMTGVVDRVRRRPTTTEADVIDPTTLLLHLTDSFEQLVAMTAKFQVDVVSAVARIEHLEHLALEDSRRSRALADAVGRLAPDSERLVRIEQLIETSVGVVQDVVQDVLRWVAQQPGGVVLGGRELHATVAEPVAEPVVAEPVVAEPAAVPATAEAEVAPVADVPTEPSDEGPFAARWG